MPLCLLPPSSCPPMVLISASGRVYKVQQSYKHGPSESPTLAGGYKVIKYHLSKQRESESAQLCPTLCDPDPVDHTVSGILQARILEWLGVPFSRGSSQPRNRTQVSCIAGRGRNLLI